ncbi:hypothetical protein Tco_0635361 [Tanacetum coccineum]
MVKFLLLKKDANMKLLRSLLSAWNNITLIMRNKSNIDTLSMDDLYNNLEGVMNMNNKVQINLQTSNYDVMFSFFANQSNSPQLDNEDLEQIETMILKRWITIGREVTLLENAGHQESGIEIEDAPKKGCTQWITPQMPCKVRKGVKLLEKNRVLVTKPHNKTPYELLYGRPPSISFMRPFGCPVTILNTLDPLGKFDGKADEGFFVGYSINITAGNQTNKNESIKDNVDAVPTQQYILLPLLYDSLQSSKDIVANDAGKKTIEERRNKRRKVSAKQALTEIVLGAYDQMKIGADAYLKTTRINHHECSVLSPPTRNHKDHPKDQIIEYINSATQTRRMTKIFKELAMNPRKSTEASTISKMDRGECKMKLQQFRLNKKDKRGIVVRNKARLVTQDDIIFGSTKKSLCAEFESLMHKKFQISSMGELIFFLGFSEHAERLRNLQSIKDNETVIKEWEDRMEKAATTASSLEAEQDSGNINRTQSMATLNESFPQGTDSGSGPRCQDTILGVQNLKLVFLDKQVEGMSRHKGIYDIPSHTKKVFTNMKRPGKGFSGKKNSRKKQRKDSGPTKPIPDEVINEEHVATPSCDPPQSGEDRMQLTELMD